MSETVAIQKQLKIKFGVVQRYEKEIKLYHQEVESLRGKLDKLVSDRAEEWDIKNTRFMIEESDKMILDTKPRLVKATGELSDLVKRVEEKPGVADTEEFKNALRVLKSSSA